MTVYFWREQTWQPSVYVQSLLVMLHSFPLFFFLVITGFSLYAHGPPASPVCASIYQTETVTDDRLWQCVANSIPTVLTKRHAIKEFRILLLKMCVVLLYILFLCLHYFQSAVSIYTVQSKESVCVCVCLCDTFFSPSLIVPPHVAVTLALAGCG